MSSLSESQIEFLKQYEIPVELVHDAEGQSKSAYASAMKKEGKILAYNVKPCDDGKHTLRTMAGDCIECNVEDVPALKKSIVFNTVYIAGSMRGRVIRIGFTRSKAFKADTLNKTKYAGYDDWEVLYRSLSIKANGLEKATQAALSKYGLSMGFNRDEKKTFELFNCSYSKAKEALLQTIEEQNLITRTPYVNITKIGSYAFRNLVKG